MKEVHPPKFGVWLLSKIYDQYLFEAVSGDLHETFIDRVDQHGAFIARLHYYKDVLLSFRNLDLRRRTIYDSPNTIPMIKTALIISFRSLMKRKSYSLLNITGLALSLAFAFLLMFYVRDQYAYDEGYAFADRIYRVNVDCNMNGKRDVYCNAPQPIARALKNDYPEVSEVARVVGFGNLEVHKGILKNAENKITSKELFVADPSVFKILDREFIEGNATVALSEPNSIVISESLAVKLFNTIHVLGKTLELPEESKLLKVTGIMKDNAFNTHLPTEAVISFDTFKEWESDWWYGAHVYTYVLLNEANNIALLQSKMPAFFNKHMKKTFDEFNGTASILLQPIKEVYLSEELVWEPYPHGSSVNVFILSIVAFLLIGFAIINYVNLSTARAAERAAEVGIRKVLGSSRLHIWMQFMGEALLLSFFAGIVSITLAALLLPYYNPLTDLHLTLPQLFSWQNIGQLILFVVSIGFLAGIIPAFYLSSLPSLSVLKGKFFSSARGEILRKGLVTSQYIIATVLIFSIMVVFQQTSYIKNKDIGFDKENLLSVHVPTDTVVRNHTSVFVEEIKKSSGVMHASRSPQGMHRKANSFTPTLQNEDGTTFQMGADVLPVDFDFLNTIGAKLLTGRSFDRNRPTDGETTMLINEAAMKKFGWTKNPLAGKMVAFTSRKKDQVDMRVIGVVKDFHLGASYQEVHPQIFLLAERGDNLYVRLPKGNVFETMDKIKAAWSKTFPGHEFEYEFVDQSLNSLYKKEEKFVTLLTTFSVLTLFITSLGIIGLISFTTELKKKEIAIRKVLGSSLRSILGLLSKKFVFLLALANLIALPIAYYLINLWLADFAYHITIDGWPFVISVIVSLVFTFTSILYHTVKAALADPVEALKYE